LTVSDLQAGHLDDVIRIDALHTGAPKPEYWKVVFERFLDARGDGNRVGLAAEDRGRTIGYLLGEVRAFEFGSEACGWIFGVGVDPSRLRTGVGGRLLNEARRRFRATGVNTIRTMVRRNDVPVLSFFRAHDFVGGSFTQLESELEESA
jgi:GNAT superfamily N-acetyltransferase